jgi:hypothetical protein
MEFEHTYDLLGVKIHLVTNSEEIREKARLFLGAHEVDPGEPSDFRLIFAEAPTLPDYPVTELKHCHPQDYVVVEKGGQVFFSVGEGVACYDPQTRTCQANVLKHAGGQQPAFASVPLVNLAVVWTMFAAGFLPVHAAAVIHEDRLIVLAGEKGAGKSTLALKLHQQGFPVICDDLVYFKRQDNRLMAGGHCQPLKLKSAEADVWLAGGLEVGGEVRVPGKKLFPVEQFNLRGKNQLHLVEAIIFLQRSTAPDIRASVCSHRDVEVVYHLLGDAPMLNIPDYRARALELMYGAAECGSYLAQTSLDADNTVREILYALGLVSGIAA